MNRNSWLSLIGVGLFACASSASATLLDFSALADASPPTGTGEVGGQPLDLSSYYGFTLRAYGSYNGSYQGAQAYLDSAGAGMGVCHTTEGCAGNTDDNLGQNEMLKLDFGNNIAHVDSLSFRNATHGTDFTSANHFEISTNGSDWVDYALAETVNITPLASHTFFFKTPDLSSSSGNSGTQYYLSAVSASVPEPGMLALLGIGLAGFGLAARGRYVRS